MKVPTLLMALIGSLNISASDTRNYDENIQTLRKIPLVKNAEKRSVRSEKKDTRILENIFSRIQADNYNNEGEVRRATHSQGTCFNGSFKVVSTAHLKNYYKYSDEIITKLGRGIFKAGSDYNAQIRFSNGPGENISDKNPGVRGFALSLDLAGAGTAHSGLSQQDYSANTSPMFAVENIKEFVQLMKTITFLQTKDPIYFPNILYAGRIAKAIKLLKQYRRTDIKSYNTENYWGNVPAVHGLNPSGTAKDITKFRITPCSGPSIVRESSQGKSNDYLQADIKDKASKTGICFKFELQFFNKKKLANYYKSRKFKRWTTADWIENGGKLWPASVLQYYTVAKIIIPKDSKSVSCQQRAVNPRLHSTPDHTPIGSLSRVRAEVEESSRNRRN